MELFAAPEETAAGPDPHTVFWVWRDQAQICTSLQDLELVPEV